MRNILFAIVFLICAVFLASANALEKPEQEIPQLALKTVLGAKLNSKLKFAAEDGSNGSLESFARNARPYILVPAYYHCPNMCGLILKGVKELISNLDLKLNEDYRVLTVSFDSSEKLENAKARHAEIASNLSPEIAKAAWRFLFGINGSEKELMNQIGFPYLPDKGEYAHGSAIMIMTPDGQISQYFTGINFNPDDVKLALVEAGRGSIGSVIDHVMLFCFRFDQTKGRYTLAAFNIMRAGGVLTLVLLLALIYKLRRSP